MASACNAQLTDDEFEAALSNSMQRFRHISGLKREQKLCLETVAQKRDVFAAATVETRPCLCFSCAFSFHNERPG